MSPFLLPFLALPLLACWSLGVTAHGDTTSVIQHREAFGELALHNAAVKAVEVISKLPQWRSDAQATIVGSLEDVNFASTTKYDYKVGGFERWPEGLEFSFSEEPELWEEVGSLALRDGEVEQNGDTALVVRQQLGMGHLATLPEIDVSGTVELWFPGSPNLRLALPHDVEAGPLKKVVVAEGATVTIVGASKISLARPLRIPLPPIDSPEELVAADVALLLRTAASRSEKPVVSLVVVGATALVSKSPVSENANAIAEAARLKVKRLSAGALELSARDNQSKASSRGVAAEGLWPFPGLSTSDDRIIAIETALREYAGNSTTFNLLKAEASALRLVRMQLNLEKKLPQSTGSGHGVLVERSDDLDELDSEQQTWEVVVTMGGRSQPELFSARRIGASVGTVSLSWSVATGNGTFVAPEPSTLSSVGLMDLDV
ncbi:hypothetical protein KFL_001170230 [Klebsormidium nitens]|uniref:Uncharacterized protein n=1 Tax=Klebsormidium nitens TaxID=105231 RepID=A0A1Y1HZK3_KLENI|nr:hypothetical protein KFL_001170230 [Klebsormidium nitens]|eukprot:GAQ82619.1 hypothetical protein KFL_001170230 [Klebsormidium nitens]